MTPIKIRLQIRGGENSVIPKNVTETLTIEIIDGLAAYHFIDYNTTFRFYESQRADGMECAFSQRLQKVLCKYPNMKQKEISDHILKRLKELGAKLS